MTGVQTCALPICRLIPAGTGLAYHKVRRAQAIAAEQAAAEAAIAATTAVQEDEDQDQQEQVA